MRNMHWMLLILLCAHLVRLRRPAAARPQGCRKPGVRGAHCDRYGQPDCQALSAGQDPAQCGVDPDSFGALLAAKLRGRGFGVAETIEAKPKVLPFAFNDEFRMRPDVPADQDNKSQRAVPGLELRYQLDVEQGLREQREPRGPRLIPCRASR